MRVELKGTKETPYSEFQVTGKNKVMTALFNLMHGKHQRTPSNFSGHTHPTKTIGNLRTEW